MCFKKARKTKGWKNQLGQLQEKHEENLSLLENCFRIWVATRQHRVWKLLLFFFFAMELPLKAIKVCFEVLMSEMQPSWLCQRVPRVSAASTQTRSSLISPTKKRKTGRVWVFACGQSGDCSVSSSMDMVSGIRRCERPFFFFFLWLHLGRCSRYPREWYRLESFHTHHHFLPCLWQYLPTAPPRGLQLC